MDHRLIEGLMEVVAPAIREYSDGAIERATKPLLAQITELNGKLAEIAAREPAKGEPGKDGSSVTIEDVRPLIVEAVEALPVPKDGASVTVDDVRPLLEGMVAAIPKPENGKDAEPVQLEQVMEAIQKFDIDQLLKDALSGDHGVDIVAPDGVAKEMAAAIVILAEPPPVRKEITPVVQQQPRPRKLTFERDEQNRIIAAVEE